MCYDDSSISSGDCRSSRFDMIRHTSEGRDTRGTAPPKRGTGMSRRPRRWSCVPVCDIESTSFNMFSYLGGIAPRSYPPRSALTMMALAMHLMLRRTRGACPLMLLLSGYQRLVALDSYLPSFTSGMDAGCKTSAGCHALRRLRTNHQSGLMMQQGSNGVR